MPSTMLNCFVSYMDKTTNEKTIKIENGFIKRLNDLLTNIVIRNKSKSINYDNYLTSNEDICDGKMVIKNTRITPETLVHYVFEQYEELNDVESAINKTIENYEVIKEEDILVSIFYCINTKKIKIKN